MELTPCTGPMTKEDSTTVTFWIHRLREGSTAAQEALWKEYHPKVLRFARLKLPAIFQRVSDEEDVALSVLKSVFIGTSEGRFPRVVDRHSLWALIMATATHKSIDLIRQQTRLKRGGVHESDVPNSNPDLQSFASPLPPADYALQVREQLNIFLDALAAEDPELLQIVVRRMQGFSTFEIAKALTCSKRTVQRRLQRVRSEWGAKFKL